MVSVAMWCNDEVMPCCRGVKGLVVSTDSHGRVLVDPYGGGNFTRIAGAVSERRTVGWVGDNWWSVSGSPGQREGESSRSADSAIASRMMSCSFMRAGLAGAEVLKLLLFPEPKRCERGRYQCSADRGECQSGEHKTGVLHVTKKIQWAQHLDQ